MDSLEIEEYLEAHSEQPNEVLAELYRWTHLHVMNPRMMSGPVQGKFLELLCKMQQPKRVLEIGTFTGYAAICIAKGLPENAHLITIEANEEYEFIIREYLEKAQVSEKVELIIGDAKKIVPTLEGPFDMVFIDADKISYPLYYDLVIEKTRSGGIILVDNVLWNGKVLKSNTKEHDTQAIIRFNENVTQDQRVENVLLPIRDGLMMIRKK